MDTLLPGGEKKFADKIIKIIVTTHPEMTFSSIVDSDISLTLERSKQFTAANIVNNS